AADVRGRVPGSDGADPFDASERPVRDRTCRLAILDSTRGDRSHPDPTKCTGAGPVRPGRTRLEMVLVSYSGKEINAKLVYYGPGLSGKTTNLEYIYGSIPGTHRGKMVSMKTKTERTLFFDFLPVQLGELSGFKTRFLLYTVP